ncbi:hypothetical protein P280DRAFT_464899 [Massarina eburnea CBS 473.64]|uniref:Uncharacterized protein n=1 Tax=Massarina eburnea CBS 473.64 TaxID=1395130 RepID=A0A6A6SJ85_9PLEO|nr:hypothetical protein P280DRAFT_464899 [Massarina eburnea CBS 473.64]
MAGNLPGAPFNIYKALLRHPNLFFQFALRLSPASLVDLYAIDKEFHYRFNKYSISIIHEHANYHAPLAAYIFSWIMFPELCISDPMARPMDERPHLARDIPSLRWTRMVVHRESVVHKILEIMALEGLMVPEEANTILMKFWLCMEMKTTALRTAFLSDRKVWTNTDIIFFHLFLVKLDMLFGDPVLGNGCCALSHLLLTQKSLTMLHDLLTDKISLDYDDISDLLVRTYAQSDLDTTMHTWLADEQDNGVRFEYWGVMCKEGWQAGGARLEPAVDMVIMEGIERGLHPEAYLADFVFYGFVEQDQSGCERNVPCPRRWRGDRGTVVPELGWPDENDRKHAIERVDGVVGVEPFKGRKVKVGVPLVRARRWGVFRVEDTRPQKEEVEDEVEDEDEEMDMEIDGTQKKKAEEVVTAIFVR